VPVTWRYYRIRRIDGLRLMANVKLILLSDLHAVGERGEVISTKPGYARNWLIPQGLAVPATNANTKWFEHQRSKIEARNRQEEDAASIAAARLDGSTIEIAKRAGETETLYGSVTATEIADALAAKDFEVDRRKIDLGGGIKTLGEHEVRIRLHARVTATVTLTVVPEE